MCRRFPVSAVRIQGDIVFRDPFCRFGRLFLFLPDGFMGGRGLLFRFCGLLRSGLLPVRGRAGLCCFSIFGERPADRLRGLKRLAVLAAARQSEIFAAVAVIAPGLAPDDLEQGAEAPGYRFVVDHIDVLKEARTPVAADNGRAELCRGGTGCLPAAWCRGA